MGMYVCMYKCRFGGIGEYGDGGEHGELGALLLLQDVFRSLHLS